MTNIEFNFIRNSFAMNQREFAELLGVTLRAVQKWERGGVKSSTAKMMLHLVAVLRLHWGQAEATRAIKAVRKKSPAEAGP